MLSPTAYRYRLPTIISSTIRRTALGHLEITINAGAVADHRVAVDIQRQGCVPAYVTAPVRGCNYLVTVKAVYIVAMNQLETIIGGQDQFDSSQKNSTSAFGSCLRRDREVFFFDKL
jgi:hypothetical protein